LPTNSDSRKAVGGTWDSAVIKEPTPTGWEAPPFNSNAGKGTGGSWDSTVGKASTPAGWPASNQQPTQSESAWTLTEPHSQRSGLDSTANKEGNAASFVPAADIVYCSLPYSLCVF
jgi:hypothetical protein